MASWRCTGALNVLLAVPSVTNHVGSGEVWSWACSSSHLTKCYVVCEDVLLYCDTIHIFWCGLLLDATLTASICLDEAARQRCLLSTTRHVMIQETKRRPHEICRIGRSISAARLSMVHPQT